MNPPESTPKIPKIGGSGTPRNGSQKGSKMTPFWTPRAGAISEPATDPFFSASAQ